MHAWDEVWVTMQVTQCTSPTWYDQTLLATALTNLQGFAEYLHQERKILFHSSMAIHSKLLWCGWLMWPNRWPNCSVVTLSTSTLSGTSFCVTSSWGHAYSTCIGAVARHNAVFGQGTGPIYLDEMRCYGSEYALIECRSYGLENHNCGHHQDAGVVCAAGKTWSQLATNTQSFDHYLWLHMKNDEKWCMGILHYHTSIFVQQLLCGAVKVAGHPPQCRKINISHKL